MCENAVKRVVVTGPPIKEKREMVPFGGIHLANGKSVSL